MAKKNEQVVEETTKVAANEEFKEKFQARKQELVALGKKKKNILRR